MSSEQPSATAAGILIAALALLPLGWLFLGGDDPDATASPVATDATASVTVITTPPPTIEGLTEAVTRVLVANGYALEEQIDELPASVVNVLSENGIALTVAEDR